MKGIMLRLPDDLLAGLREKAGKGQINAVLTRLVKEYLGVAVAGRLEGEVVSPDITAMISSAQAKHRKLVSGEPEVISPEVVGCVVCGEPARERRVRGQVAWLCDGCAGG